MWGHNSNVWFYQGHHGGVFGPPWGKRTSERRIPTISTLVRLVIVHPAFERDMQRERERESPANFASLHPKPYARIQTWFVWFGRCFWKARMTSRDLKARANMVASRTKTQIFLLPSPICACLPWTDWKTPEDPYVDIVLIFHKDRTISSVGESPNRSHLPSDFSSKFQ